jgi:hypothetical protein
MVRWRTENWLGSLQELREGVTEQDVAKKGRVSEGVCVCGGWGSYMAVRVVVCDCGWSRS